MDFENVRERNRHGDDQDMQKIGVEKYIRLTAELTAETSQRHSCSVPVAHDEIPRQLVSITG